MEKNKKVSLALSAGGARGYAHIGVIEVLEKYGFEIISVAGASMGAVVGGIYAAGKLDIYKEWVESLEKIDVIRLLSLSFNRKGLFKEDKIINHLYNLIGDVKIEDFKIKFTAVAVDLTNHKEIWFTKGSLFEAIRASTAIPGIFTPQIKDNRIIVDGGVLNPLPIAPVLNDEADLIVAVDVNSSNKMNFSLLQNKEKSDEQNFNLVDIMMQSVYIMQGKITKYQLAAYSPDIIIEIPRTTCNIFDFHMAKELIEIGKISTENALTQFFMNN